MARLANARTDQAALHGADFFNDGGKLRTDGGVQAAQTLHLHVKDAVGS
jgi:hypothetical protein